MAQALLKLGYLGLDVYEREEQIFFEDRSGVDS
jgi:hypothetical protein